MHASAYATLASKQKTEMIIRLSRVSSQLKKELSNWKLVRKFLENKYLNYS